MCQIGNYSMKPNQIIVHGHQFQLYGHVAHYSKVNYVHQGVSVQSSHECRRLRGHP